jgi:DNA-binding HxlR family transcriptional regulator
MRCFNPTNTLIPDLKRIVPGVVAQKTYNQSCPVAKGLDVLGERWTLLILREMIGGPRRYSDLRAALPGIATTLLADRLRGLEHAGLVDRTELPPPIARTVYALSELGWRKVPPVLQAIATFGLDQVELTDRDCTPLNGFLAGILLGFDPERAAGHSAAYRIEIDGRSFEFAVNSGQLAAARNSFAVTVSATSLDMIAARLGETAAQRKSALQRLKFVGDDDAVDAMRQVFQLSAT